MARAQGSGTEGTEGAAEGREATCSTDGSGSRPVSKGTDGVATRTSESSDVGVSIVSKRFSSGREK